MNKGAIFVENEHNSKKLFLPKVCNHLIFIFIFIYLLILYYIYAASASYILQILPYRYHIFFHVLHSSQDYLSQMYTQVLSGEAADAVFSVKLIRKNDESMYLSISIYDVYTIRY